MRNQPSESQNVHSDRKTGLALMAFVGVSVLLSMAFVLLLSACSSEPQGVDKPVWVPTPTPEVSEPSEVDTSVPDESLDKGVRACRDMRWALTNNGNSDPMWFSDVPDFYVTTWGELLIESHDHHLRAAGESWISMKFSGSDKEYTYSLFRLLDQECARVGEPVLGSGR